MDDIDKLFSKLIKRRLIYKRPRMINIYDVSYQIDPNSNKYTKKEAIAAVLKWMFNGRRR